MMDARSEAQQLEDAGWFCDIAGEFWIPPGGSLSDRPMTRQEAFAHLKRFQTGGK
jgi:hypothetical protein